MMSTHITSVWNDLSTSPLTGLTLTLLAYVAGLWIFEKGGRRAILNPVLTAMLLLVTVLNISNISYADYFSGAQFIHFLLGPATVALAVPLYNQLGRVRRSLRALVVAIGTGSVCAAGSAIALAWAAGVSPATLASIAPKSVTSPIAMGIAEQIGGLPSLAAVVVILTGILGAVVGPGILRLTGVRDRRACGVAMGTVCHGVGTARALQHSEVSGAFSSLSMGLNGLATAIILPILWVLFTG
ncbi:LrgB family protein [Haematospirillum jordaniae]|nr:LrgB family protein [Haematospirillum jordaniae]